MKCADVRMRYANFFYHKWVDRKRTVLGQIGNPMLNVEAEWRWLADVTWPMTSPEVHRRNQKCTAGTGSRPPEPEVGRRNRKSAPRSATPEQEVARPNPPYRKLVKLSSTLFNIGTLIFMCKILYSNPILYDKTLYTLPPCSLNHGIII
jgi:hypothetical protein